MVLEFFPCPSAPCLEKLASILFVGRIWKVTQKWLCCCHSPPDWYFGIFLTLEFENLFL